MLKRLHIRIMVDITKPGHDMMLKVIEAEKGNRGVLPEFVYGVLVNGIVTPAFEEGAAKQAKKRKLLFKTSRYGRYLIF